MIYNKCRRIIVAYQTCCKSKKTLSCSRNHKKHDFANTNSLWCMGKNIKNYLVTNYMYPCAELRVSPTVCFASSMANLKRWWSSRVHFLLLMTRNCDGLMSTKRGITFFLHSMRRASS